MEQRDSSEKEIQLKFKKIRVWQGLTFLFGILFVVSLFTGGFGIGDDSAPTGRAVAPSPSAPSPSGSTRFETDIKGDPVKGDEDAPVTIVEFSDFQCPFCSRFYSQTLPQIEKEYIDTGKVKFVYKDFPLNSIHPQATPAALAAACADEQDKFWEYHDKLFENVQIWASAGESEYKKYAEELALDTSKFNDCFDSEKYIDEINDDLSDATSAGGRGTPYFLINGRPLSGAQPFSSFQQVIEAELSGN